MPQPIVLGDTSGIAQGIQTAGGALAGALAKRGQNQLEERKKNAFQTSIDDAIIAGGIDTPEGQQAFLSTYSKEGGDPFKAMGMFKKNSAGQTVFEKKIDEFKAESVINYMQGGDASTRNFGENLDYLESNVESVGRQNAIFGGGGSVLGGGEYGPFKSEKFAEYENRGNLVLDGVIKVFNKSGVLPQKKLEWIRKTFAISPFDTQEQIKGKINSLRSLSKDASSFNDGMGRLIEKHGQNIPNEEFLKLQKGLDGTMKKYDQVANATQDEKVVKTLSNKGYKKGDKATNTETGEDLMYNGTRWIKQK